MAKIRYTFQPFTPGNLAVSFNALFSARGRLRLEGG